MRPTETNESYVWFFDGVVAADRLSGMFKKTVNPDDYVPADRKPASVRYDVNWKVNGGTLAGTYEGVHGAIARKGVIEGIRLPEASDEGVYRLLLLHGMARLNQTGGMNKGYALDMRLRFQFERGQASHALFENVVPDYRRYSATVASLNVTNDGAKFAATMVVALDSGLETRDATGKVVVPRYETNTFTLAGFRIGDRVAGRHRATGEGLDVTDFFTGEVDREAPPAPAGSKVFLRLHGAMRNDYPILLNLFLPAKGEVHGFAWASGYNHQPHEVEASKLKLDGNRLTGEVVVTIWPDVYKPIEDVVVRHQLDVTFDRGVASGRFKGADNDQPFEGIVTGELTRMKPPAVTMKTIGSCQLSLQSGVKGGHAEMTLKFADGKAAAFEVKYPQWKDPYEARMGTCGLKVDGSRLCGSVGVIVKDKDGKESEFTYRMDAMLDGDQLTGYWHGMTAGKPILNKSSKLYGKATPAASGAPTAGP